MLQVFEFFIAKRSEWITKNPSNPYININKYGPYKELSM